MKTNLYIFADGVEAAKDAPDSILLMPYGKSRYTRNGEHGEIEITPADAASMVEAFNAGSRDVVVDYEHQTLKNEIAPAAGWIEGVEATPDGVRAKIRGWTDKAKQMIADWEYRYYSPVVETLKGGGKRLHSVALTNHPALHGIPALVASDDDNNDPETQNNNKEVAAMEKFQKLAHALGIQLAADIDEAGAIDALAAGAEALAAAKSQSESKVEAMSDYDTAKAELEALKAANAKLAAESAVKQAFSDRKLTEDMRGWAVSLAEKDLQAFADWCKVAPALKAEPPKSTPDPKVGEPDPKTDDTVVALSDSDKQIFARLGIKPEEAAELIKTKKKEAE
jgi:phage I-like protein